MRSVKRISLIQVLHFAFFYFLCNSAKASEISYSHSQSDSSKSDKYKLSYSFNSQNKLSISYRLSTSSENISDKTTSTLKLAYRYKTEEKTAFTLDYRKIDDDYFFEGQSLGLKISQPFAGDFTFDLNAEVAEKKYSLSTSESLFETQIGASVDYEFQETLLFGFDLTIYNYSANSTNLKEALSKNTIANSDISSYVNTLLDRSTLVYAEYFNENISLGLSYNLNHYLIDSSNSTSIEIYSDIYFLTDFSLMLSYSQSQSDLSTSTTNSYLIGLGYDF